MNETTTRHRMVVSTVLWVFDRKRQASSEGNRMERLWEIVEKEKIEIEYEDFSSVSGEIHGLYIYDSRFGSLILLGKHIQHSRRLHKCVLAHELGHFYTTPRTSLLSVHTSASLKIMQSQDERKAIQWAADFLIPDSELDKALRYGCCSCYELAEWFDVTQWFMYRKLNILRACFRRLGWKVKCRDMYEIKLQPCHLIE